MGIRNGSGQSTLDRRWLRIRGGRSSFCDTRHCDLRTRSCACVCAGLLLRHHGYPLPPRPRIHPVLQPRNTTPLRTPNPPPPEHGHKWIPLCSPPRHPPRHRMGHQPLLFVQRHISLPNHQRIVHLWSHHAGGSGRRGTFRLPPLDQLLRSLQLSPPPPPLLYFLPRLLRPRLRARHGRAPWRLHDSCHLPRLHRILPPLLPLLSLAENGSRFAKISMGRGAGREGGPLYLPLSPMQKLCDHPSWVLLQHLRRAQIVTQLHPRTSFSCLLCKRWKCGVLDSVQERETKRPHYLHPAPSRPKVRLSLSIIHYLLLCLPPTPPFSRVHLPPLPPLPLFPPSLPSPCPLSLLSLLSLCLFLANL